MQLVGLDTNIFIYYFQKHPQFGPLVKPLFESLVKKKLKGVTSVIAIAELLSLKALESDINRLKMLYFEIPNLTTISVSESIAFESARIRRTYGFRLPDSIQLATALQLKVDEFI